MSELCKLCGEPIENGCKHEFKKMCLNCKDVMTNVDGYPVCGNKENMEAALQPVIDAIKNLNGYEADASQLKVKPLALKNPTKKCGHWSLSDEVVEQLKTLFV